MAATDWPGIAQVITALGIVIVAIYQIWANMTLKRMALSLKQVKEDVHKVEVATNSMKDALVKAAGEAGMAEGEAKGRADQKAEAHQESQAAKLEEYQINAEYPAAVIEIETAAEAAQQPDDHIDDPKPNSRRHASPRWVVALRDGLAS